MRRVSDPFYGREPEAQRLTLPSLQSSETELRPVWLSALACHTHCLPPSLLPALLLREGLSLFPPSQSLPAAKEAARDTSDTQAAGEA